MEKSGELMEFSYKAFVRVALACRLLEPLVTLP
jgi:hypothetical protein